jgi:CubicO group peptidase (beta-lactamase class C family)
MRIIFITALLLLQFVINAQTTVQRVDSLMKSEAALKAFSGVLLVAEKGKPVYAKAYGYRDFAKKIPLLKTDIFELASVSKQFTSMIIMMLKEKKQLQYDDPVEKYLTIPYKGITIRHLLTHTSGLPDYQEIMDKYWDKTKVAGNADAIDYLNKYAPPALFEPGTKYSYSNTGYLLLASIAEKVTGRDFIDLCRKWIFIPLKMKNTDIRSLEVKAATKNFAIGHIYIAEQGRYIRADSFPSSDYTIWLGNRKGPGRISSTAADLLLWDQALYTNKLIPQQTLAEAFTPMKLKDGSISDYGFGWVISNDSVHGKIVYHTGDNPGYHTQIRRFIDENKTIILLNNNASDEMQVIIDAVTAFLSK